MPPLVVLSYSNRDKSLMHRIRATLQAAEFSVWDDEEYAPGLYEWKHDFSQAVKAAVAVVVILSPNARMSGWIPRQLQYAAMRKALVFALLAEGQEADVMLPELDGAEMIDIRPPADFHKQMQTLIERLRTQAQTVAEAHAVQAEMALRLKALSARNPMNHLRLMNWLFLRPERLNEYRERGGDMAIRKVGSWLATTILWIPLLIAALGYGLGAVPGVSDTNLYPLGLVLLGWLATGWIGQNNDEETTRAAGMITAVLAGALSVLINQHVPLAMALAVTVGVTSGVVIGVVERICFEVVYGSAVGLAGGALVGLALGLLLEEAGGDWLTAFVQAGAIGLFGGAVLALAVSEGVTRTMDENQRTGKASGRSKVFLFLLVGVNTGLAALYVLGGEVL